ncbi:hypothetical protein AVEN_16102-1 [Araneus ventricosus]|uniref:Uncharacterized protein n=1 Tax=Araneus ventricosus TaxID=182803 RepID=A0A4Y2LPJ2_ARAVE|nr:hypothetical protein AVEN_16102-1 [Araneus ventricosus]
MSKRKRGITGDAASRRESIRKRERRVVEAEEERSRRLSTMAQRGQDRRAEETEEPSNSRLSDMTQRGTNECFGNLLNNPKCNYLLKRILKFLEEGTRGASWDGPLKFEARSDDEDDTCAGNSSPQTCPPHQQGDVCLPTYDLACNRPTYKESLQRNEKELTKLGQIRRQKKWKELHENCSENVTVVPDVGMKFFSLE